MNRLIDYTEWLIINDEHFIIKQGEKLSAPVDLLGFDFFLFLPFVHLLTVASF